MSKKELLEQVEGMSEEEASEVRLIFAPDWPSKATSITEIRKRTGTRAMSPEKFEAFMAEYGPRMLSPDGEGLGGHAARRMSASSLARVQSTPNQHCDLLLAATFVATPEHLRP